MKISMIGSFQILKKQGKEFIPLTLKDIDGMSIGGYSFEINGNMIPFDWDAFILNENDGVFEFETGNGPFFKDYEIPNYYDEEYKEIGITRESISAEFLASASGIEDFFINFDDKDGEEYSLGWHADNVNSSQYKINIIDLAFVDVEKLNTYKVSKEVIDKYNKGLM